MKPGSYMHHGQAGLTLVELMISIALGLFVVLAATALLISTKSSYVTEDEEIRVQDTGRHAIELITRAVRQAAYENWDSDEAPLVTTASMTANLAGLDARRVSATSTAIASPLTDGVVNGSDVLAIRFFGAGTGAQGDGTILNCAGLGVPAATSSAEAEEARGWAIFYVARSESRIPGLYCKYKGKNGNWSAQAVASGVESFQILYGVDTDTDGLPNKFLNAAGVHDLDKGLGSDLTSLTHWKKVVVVKVALLLQSLENARADVPMAQYDLFGPDYSASYAKDDIGTRIQEEALSKDARKRLRKIFTATIQLRNQPLPDPA